VRTLALGVSTRSLVESAVRAGHELVAVDYFGDRDQARLVEAYALRRHLGLPLSSGGLEAAAKRIEADAVVYCANLENHPDIVDRLQAGRTILGNSGAVLRRVRDPRLLREHCREAGVACPRTLLPGEESQADPAGRWLVKRVRSGGGHGIRLWRGGRLAGGHVLQELVAGVPASVTFVADGRESMVLGLTEQILGHEALGATGFGWCGNLAPLDLGGRESVVREQVVDMVGGLSRRFGLRGVNGVDLVIDVARDGRPRTNLVEVNPRFCASMELLERSLGVSIYELHVRALAGSLPGPMTAPAAGCFGKAVVFARSSAILPDTTPWLEGQVRDVPPSRQRMRAGHPICTVLARGRDRRICFDELLLRAASIYSELEQGGGERCERAIHAGHRTYA